MIEIYNGFTLYISSKIQKCMIDLNHDLSCGVFWDQMIGPYGKINLGFEECY